MFGEDDIAQVMATEMSQERRIDDEFALYIRDAYSTPKDADPFLWWKNNHSKYPLIAKLARKWLGTVATSVPSERAFSTSGNTVTAKRCSLSLGLVRDVVFISENFREKKTRTKF
jgi:hypothetical protein